MTGEEPARRRVELLVRRTWTGTGSTTGLELPEETTGDDEEDATAEPGENVGADGEDEVTMANAGVLEEAAAERMASGNNGEVAARLANGVCTA